MNWFIIILISIIAFNIYRRRKELMFMIQVQIGRIKHDMNTLKELKNKK